MGRKQRAEENRRERARARSGEQKVCEAYLASPRPAPVTGAEKMKNLLN